MENTDELSLDNRKPEWFVAEGDEWIGPLTAHELYRRIRVGELTWAHYVMKQGQGEWKRACEAKPFLALAPGAPKKEVRAQVKEASRPGIRKSVRHARVTPPPPVDGEGSPAGAQWYLYYNHTQFGPFSAQEIIRNLKIEKINARVHAWRDGMNEWTRLEALEEFQDARTGVKVGSAKVSKKEDQRSQPRRPLVARILIASQDSVIVGICRDISVGGMQVLTDRIPGPVGSQIKINVSPAGSVTGQPGAGPAPFVAEGKIVRVLEDGRGFSFRFYRLPEISRQAIERYIEFSGEVSGESS